MLIAKSIIIVSLILLVLIGINIPLIIFDLILKVISFVSGSTFFNSIISGTFNIENPVFITYTTIFILTLIMSIGYTITYSIKRIYNQGNIDNNQGFRKSDFFNRFKFMIYWLIGFFLVPFLVNLLLIGVSSISSLFGLEILSNGIYEEFSKESILSYLNNILVSGENHLKELEIIKNSLITIKESISNGDIFFNPSELELLDNQLIHINNSINELTKLNILVNNLSQKIMISNEANNISYQIKDILEIKNIFGSISNAIDNNILKNIIDNYNIKIDLITTETIDPDIINIYSNSFNKLETILNDGEKIEEHVLNINLNNISVLNSDNIEYISEKTTIILSEILYGEPILNPFQNFNNGNFLGDFILVISNIFGKIFELLNNFVNEIPIIIKTIALVFTLSSFMNIAINFGKRTFQLVGLVIVSPYFFISGIKDEGLKLTIWFETIIGKILLIVFVSLSIEIWSILLLSLNEIPTVIFGVYGDVSNNIGFEILQVFIQAILLVSSTYALLEFINYLSEIFKAQDMFQSKNRLYGREFKQTISGTSHNVKTVFDKSKSSIAYGRERFDMNSDTFKNKDKSTFGKYINAPIKKYNNYKNKKSTKGK